MTTDTTPRAALWKLVPVTPTPEMMEAFYREWERGQWSGNDWTPVFHRAYKAALAASTPPPAVEAQDLADLIHRLRFTFASSYTVPSLLQEAADAINRLTAAPSDAATIAEHMQLVDGYAMAYRAGEPVKDVYHAVQDSARRLSKQPLVDPARSSAEAAAGSTSEQRSLDAVDAARYRWLVENSFDREGQTQLHVWRHTWEPHSQTGEPIEWESRVLGPAIDRAIDAARRGEQDA